MDKRSDTFLQILQILHMLLIQLRAVYIHFISRDPFGSETNP